MFDKGTIRLSTAKIHTVKPLKVDIPKGKLTVVTGVSGFGKTTLILESLVPGLEASLAGEKLPEHVLSLEAEGKETGYKAGDFSYNTGKLRCPLCDGTGVISLDVQFLPDVEIPCLNCHGSRYAKSAYEVKYRNQSGQAYSFDEPTIGLHPLDVKTPLGVFQTLIDNGATAIVIEHDLDVIRNGDYIIDMGPGGGEEGGRIIALGTPEEVARDEKSITGRYLAI